MNILKLGVILFTAVGLGFGVNQIEDPVKVEENEVEETEVNEDYVFSVGEMYCHSNDDFSNHMFDRLSDDELEIVQAKIDELLISYNATLEDVYSDRDLHYQFMQDLMIFLDEMEYDYHYYNQNYNEYGHHMRRN